ncbi:hypothetical protein LEP1GSC058_1154 [Leptospira fainei serovar Hurstbridge str. BUT 6]|uniref:Uncharacterized protein n=1 Tax=Leptospira fainei serovar Hurstbridge str. BUT 6 TaxID=1193011 RepID=S3V8J6_9LEPT|nr:hypothetical protein LEP1GSC058_1154 [Leptospira fainei serovar Hurstbridge str. BUT 6]
MKKGVEEVLFIPEKKFDFEVRVIFDTIAIITTKFPGMRNGKKVYETVEIISNRRQ